MSQTAMRAEARTGKSVEQLERALRQWIKDVAGVVIEEKTSEKEGN
jgi:hypothetical protein